MKTSKNQGKGCYQLNLDKRTHVTRHRDDRIYIVRVPKYHAAYGYAQKVA